MGPHAAGRRPRRITAKHRRRVVVLSLVLAPPIALSPSTASAQRYLVHTYSETDGLPSSTTNDLAQDAEGRMWFATRSGIAMYDGVEWTPYSTSDGLASPDQFGLAVDQDGTLWAACAAAPFTVSSYRAGRWHPLTGPLKASEVDERTSAFAVTRRNGRTVAALATTARRLVIWDGERWEQVDSSHGLPLPVSGIVGCRERFIVGTRRGLATIAGSPREPALEVFDGMPSEEVLGLAVEPRSDASRCRLWVAGTDWLGVLEGDAFTRVAEGVSNVFGRGYRSLVLEPDRRGGVFFGNPLGLRHFDPRRGLEELTPRSGLVAVGATSILVDREENVWIGSLRGVSKIASFRFATYDQQHGLLENEVTAVLERRRGGYVLGHARGLTFLDAGEPRTLVLERPEVSESNMRILDLAEERAGTLWVAASGLGLARIGAEGGVRWISDDGGPEVVHSVLVDRRGAVWVLSPGALYRWNGRRLVAVAGAPSTGNRRLFEGASGALYVATGGDGLHVLQEREWSRWEIGAGDANDVFAVLEDPDRGVWIGTAHGLFIRRAGVVERAQLGDATVTRRVYFLVRDRGGRLWIGSDNGVLRWGGGELTHFTVLDGLAGRETNRAAGRLDSSGRVWIGTEQGVSVYDAARERLSEPVPRVELRFLEVSGRRLPLDEPVRLDEGQSDLYFHFRGLSFVDESRLLFRSRLEGFESSWTAASSSPGIRYTNLSPGAYRFHVQAANSGGGWSDAVSSAPIAIPRPFLGSPAFYALIAVAAGWCLYLFQGYVSQKRYSRRLEEDVRGRTAELSQVNAELRAEVAERERAEAERERLISELEAKNAELESFTYTVSHDLKSPLVTIEGFLGWLERDAAAGDESLVKRDAERIRAATGRMQLLLDELLQLSRAGRVANRPSEVSLQELVGDTLQMLAGEIAERGVDVEVAGDLPVVIADRGRLLQVLQNLVRNSVRFMGDQRQPRIEISAREGPTEVVCCVRDNGIGLEPQHHERVFRLFERLDPGLGGTGIGLALADRIVKAHGGRIWIDSNGAGRGTAVCFTLPKRRGAEHGDGREASPSPAATSARRRGDP